MSSLMVIKLYANQLIVIYLKELTDASRSLKLWMVLRLYGLENLQSYIRNHITLAKNFEEFVTQDPRFEVIIFSINFFVWLL